MHITIKVIYTGGADHSYIFRNIYIHSHMHIYTTTIKDLLGELDVEVRGGGDWE